MKLDGNRLAAAFATAIVIIMALWCTFLLIFWITTYPSALLFLGGFFALVVCCYWCLKDDL